MRCRAACSRSASAADDAALSLYVTLLRHELAETWPKVEDRLGASRKPDQAAIREAVEPAVDRALGDVEQVRAKLITAVDSTSEVERLDAACSQP